MPSAFPLGLANFKGGGQYVVGLITKSNPVGLANFILSIRIYDRKPPISCEPIDISPISLTYLSSVATQPTPVAPNLVLLAAVRDLD